jgi:hypothetical protein
MQVIADTTKLVRDEIITTEQAAELERRGREAMIEFGVGVILTLGILAATGGLIFWLASAASVAIAGTLFLVVGLGLLLSGGASIGIIANALTLIGAGMLVGGGALDLVENHEGIAAEVLTVAGALIVVIAASAFRRWRLAAPFVTGAVLLMGLAAHLLGLGLGLAERDVSGLPITAFYLYASAVIAAAGWYVDTRFVTALAIAPFAQALDTGTFYFHAAYVFYSPEPTLSILQMSALIAAAVLLSRRVDDQIARHLGILAILAFIVLNLCALVGSLWGDYVGETLWGPGYYRYTAMSYEEWNALRDAFRASAVYISEDLYSILWAAGLIAMVFWAAHRHRRGLFNAALTFGAIHAYTQLFESFGDEPLAWAIGGLAAIPAAWMVWVLNRRLRPGGA